LDDAHNYTLDCVIDPLHRRQNLVFYRLKEDGSETNGVTNEEVLEVLIHRLRRLNEKIPCKENEIVITKLEECQFWLNKRTEDRFERKVEGTHKP
jgi:KaiC/GvpD/RAD55 family RecA-like ATPase